MSDSHGLFDSHCHLTDEQFRDDIEDVLGRSQCSGIAGILSVATGVEDARQTVNLAESRDVLRAAVGIHPNYAADFCSSAIDQLRTLASNHAVVAIGEIGLDFYREFTPAAKQIEAFEAQLSLAAELGLPVTVHNRQADDEVMARLESHSRAAAGRLVGRPPGVLHCFSGDRELAARALDAGYLISFAGNLTYKSAGGLRAVARWLPKDAILLETDAPYLAPVPVRGKRNEPKHLAETFSVLTEIRQTTATALARQLRSNCSRVFGWPAPGHPNAHTKL